MQGPAAPTCSRPSALTRAPAVRSHTPAHHRKIRSVTAESARAGPRHHTSTAPAADASTPARQHASGERRHRAPGRPPVLILRFGPGGRGAAGEQGRGQADRAGGQGGRRQVPARGESGDREPGQAEHGGGEASQQEQGRPGPIRPDPGGQAAHRPLGPHDGHDQRHEYHGEQGEPGQAQLPPLRRPDRGLGHHPGRVEGHGDDYHRHEMPQVDGHRRRVQAPDGPPQARPGQQPGGGGLGRDNQPALRGCVGEQRDRRRVGVARADHVHHVPVRGQQAGQQGRAARGQRVGAPPGAGQGAVLPGEAPLVYRAPRRTGSWHARSRARATRSRPCPPGRPPQP
jgi:hypothetical protein